MTRSVPISASQKKSANLSINAELLAEAKALGINLSRTMEKALIEEIREARRKAWLANNGDAIDDYNARIARDDVFSEGFRRF